MRGEGVGDAWEPLYKAVRYLAGEGSLRERLIMAWQDAGIIDNIVHHAELPDEIHNELLKIDEGLARDDDVAATVKNLSDDEADVFAQRILDLFVSVVQTEAREP